TLDGGYNFNNRKNNTLEQSYTQNFLNDYTRLENASTDDRSDNYSHSVSANLEYRQDSLNFFKISPRFNYNTGDVNNTGLFDITQPEVLTVRNNQTLNNTLSSNFSTNMFYLHRFKKPGRNISFRANLNYSNNENDRDVLNNYIITESGIDSLRLQHQLTENSNRSLRTWAQFSYMEPLWERTFVEFSYQYSTSNNKSNRNTNDIATGIPVFNPDLSNDYEYRF